MQIKKIGNKQKQKIRNKKISQNQSATVEKELLYSRLHGGLWSFGSGLGGRG
jgi:hypothetical protein